MSPSKQFFLTVFLLLFLLAAPSRSESISPDFNSRFMDVVAKNFSTWDTNQDQTLSREELDAAIQDPANKGPAAAALAVLKRAGGSRPLTLEKLRQANESDQKGLAEFFEQFLKRINGGTNRDLYASGVPQLSTIHQGRMGNCFCLGPLGAMLNRDPQDIARLFSIQPDGRVLVRFAGGPVSVAPPTDAELALTAGNSHDGVWINLYEKAMGQARNERLPANKRFTLAIDAIAEGGSPEPILSYLTGHKVGGFSIRFGDNPDAPARMSRLRQQLVDAVQHKRLMTCSTEKTTTPGLVPHHAYALLDYDSHSDTVKLWNPHGDNFTPNGPAGLTNGFPTTNGIFFVPLPEMPFQFAHVSIERAEPATLQWLDEWDVLAESSRFRESAAELSEVIDLDPSAVSQYVLTPLLIESGRIGEYRTHCKAMLDQYEKTTSPSIAEQTAKSCLLLPASVDKPGLARAAAVAARAVELSKKGDWMHWRLMTRGLAEYRTGQYNAALQTEAQSRNSPEIEEDLNGPSCEADTYFISAMAHVKLNQMFKARADLNQALEIIRTKLPKLDSGDLGRRWFDTLMANIIMREACPMIKFPPIATHQR